MSADKCRECGSPLKSEDELCKSCDDALLVPLVPDIPEDLTEPDSDSMPVNEEPAQADENEPHLNKVFSKSRIIATASVLIVILVIGALLSFTDIFSRNDASESPEEDADFQENSGLYNEMFVLENPPASFIIETTRETTTSNHESTSNDLLELRNVFNTYFEDVGFRTVYAFLDERGLVINFPLSEIFVNKSNVLSEDGLIILEYISTQLSYYSFELITVEHHSDIFDLLISYYNYLYHDDPEDLFNVISRNVYSILSEFFDIGTSGFEYSYFGPSSPIATNSTEEGRLLNNRLKL